MYMLYGAALQFLRRFAHFAARRKKISPTGRPPLHILEVALIAGIPAATYTTTQYERTKNMAEPQARVCKPRCQKRSDLINPRRILEVQKGPSGCAGAENPQSPQSFERPRLCVYAFTRYLPTVPIDR
jgi:hypothetical protein